MGEGPWDEWTGTDSLLERIVDGKTARLEGTGILELEQNATSEELERPRGPGRVRFTLLCNFDEFRSPRQEAILVRLQSQDEAAFRMIRGGATQPFTPLPRYRLNGSASTELGELPVHMSAITLDSRSIAPINVSGKEKEKWGVAPVFEVTMGPLSSVQDITECRVLMPNFVDEATVEGGGVRIVLKEVSDEATRCLSAPESRGKILPGSYLDVHRLEEDAGENFESAVSDFGWLLSFYAGRRIQPIAWEGHTERGTVWRIYDKQIITPLNEDYTQSCLSDKVPLQDFLQQACRAWQSYDEEQRLRLRGATNAYTDILTATFSTQTLALVTMYLERFREMFVGGSELIEGSESRKKRVATELRRALRDAVTSSERLNENEKEILQESLLNNPGKIREVFRKSFKQSLLELYASLNLNVDDVQIGRFIKERDVVLHGSWDSGPEGTLETYRLAQHGLYLFEIILLRLFSYKGLFRNRAAGHQDVFHPAP